MRVLRRLAYWLRLRSNQGDLADEIALHRQLLEEELVASGMSEGDARAAARRAMGNDTYMREEARAVWFSARLEALAQDFGYALRGLRRNPGFTIAVGLTLALGIGANATMFSLVDRLLLRPPPLLVEPGTVNRVYLYRTYRGVEAERSGQYARFLDLRRWTAAFARIAAFRETDLAVGLGDDAKELPVGVVSASFFGFFDAPPVLGRYFVDAEDLPPNGTDVAVLSHSFWQTHYAGRASVLDSTIQVGPTRLRIIGVAPGEFAGLWPDRPPVAYIPVTVYGSAGGGTDWWSAYTHAIGIRTLVRRKPGVSVAAATADLTQALTKSYRAQIAIDPTSPPLALTRPRALAASVLAERGPEASGTAKVAAWLSIVSFAVLLIACANVANLLLARALRRRREIAVRLSLGVSRARLFVQTLTESILLALLGGVAGVLVAQWGAAALRRGLLPDANAAPVITDWRTLGFAAVVTMTVGILVGLAPVLQSRRADLVEDLKSGAREGKFQRSRIRAALLVVQSALSVALLVAAGLFVQSLRNVRDVRLGYDVDPVLVVGWNLRGVQLDSVRMAELNARLLAAAASTPGVAHASLVKTVPFRGISSWPLFVAGIDSVDQLGEFDLNGVSPEYFATVGTRIVRGRGIESGDDARSRAVMVVDQSMAAVLWPGRDPIGQCVHVGAARAPCTYVVGVAEDVHTHTLGSEAGNYFYYLSAAQMSPDDVGLFVRPNGDAARYVEPLRRRLQRELPGAAYVVVDRLSDVIGSETRTWRVGAAVFTALGALAAVLAAIGLYGVIAYGVAQRTHELGVRLALGAARWSLVRLVVVDGVRFTLLGIVLGCAIALSASGRIAPLLFSEPPRDPLVYGAVTALLLVVAMLASAIPALRAASVDPKRALLAE
jgi:putative ABC transport system permease protein